MADVSALGAMVDASVATYAVLLLLAFAGATLHRVRRRMLGMDCPARLAWCSCANDAYPQHTDGLVLTIDERRSSAGLEPLHTQGSRLIQPAERELCDCGDALCTGWRRAEPRDEVRIERPDAGYRDAALVVSEPPPAPAMPSSRVERVARAVVVSAVLAWGGVVAHEMQAHAAEPAPPVLEREP